MNIPVLVFTSDKYMHALKAFSWLFNKYWGSHQEVRIVCFQKPDFALPSNFSLYSMGDMHRYPVTRWSNAALDYLKRHPELTHFILMLEDYWITRPVDLEAVSMLSDYARQFLNVLKVDLCADRLYAKGATDYGHCGRLDLIKSAFDSPYHMSLMTGIWNKELFMRFVIPEESPWEIEITGTNRLAEAGDEVLVIGTRQWPVRHILAHRGGVPNVVLTEGLQTVDIQAMQQLGYLQDNRVEAGV